MLSPGLSRAEPVVGPGVGNADLLVAEGTRLYNEKKYEQARDNFLKATRVAPGNLATYLSLARSYSALKDMERAVIVYRVFVKNAPESVDRTKAQSELELCEKRLKTSRAKQQQLSQGFVTVRASFFDKLEKGELSAAAVLLTSLVVDGYATPELGDLATKLAKDAESAAEQIYKNAVGYSKVTGSDLRKAGELYKMALDFGAAPARQAARAAFLEGMALLQEGNANQAEMAFEDAAKKEPADVEARFYRGLAKYIGGDKEGALRLLRSELPSDARTGVLQMAVAMEGTPAEAAAELEKFLFSKRYKDAP